MWVLLGWGAYLYYLLLDTGGQVQYSDNRCRELNCIFARQCQHWQSVDLSCRYLRQDLLSLAQGRVRFLQLAVNAAPLMGLLGTVIGIFTTFQGLGTFQATGAGTSSVLSDGISQALLTTQMGLIIAIPSFVWLRVIVRRLEAMDRSLTCFELQCHRTWLGENGPSSTAPITENAAHSSLQPGRMT